MTAEVKTPPIDPFLRRQPWKPRGIDPATGRKLCYCGCGQPVGPGRKSSAGPECVKRWQSHSDINHIRWMVERRDKGVCALCGRDTIAMREKVRPRDCPVDRPDPFEIASALGYKHQYREEAGYGFHWKPDVQAAYEVAEWIYGEIINDWWTHQADLRREMFGSGFPDPNRRWWEADHIVPVIEGGGGCDHTGYRTLCIPCHKAETKKLAARRAERRRAARKENQPVLELQSTIP